MARRHAAVVAEEARPSASRRTWDRRALGALLLVALALVAELVASLSHEAQRRSGSNGLIASLVIGQAGKGATFCQPHELLPARTGALRIVLSSPGPPGPRIEVVLRHGGRVLDRSSAAGWRGDFVDIPIRPTTRDVSDVDVCFAVTRGTVMLLGGPTPPYTGSVVSGSKNTHTSMPIEYLRPGRESWWSYAPTVMRRMGMGRGDWGGGWIVGLIAALVLGSLALTIRIVLGTLVGDRPRAAGEIVPASPAAERSPWERLRALRRRVPPTAWAILAIAALNAAAWSLIVPVFQGPDEITHIAYAQEIAEAGRPPVDRIEPVLPPELTTAMADMRFGALGRGIQHAGVWSRVHQERLERHLHASLSRHGNGDAAGSDPEPPLYYALEAIPYKLATGATLLDRIALMRLLSALMAGCTALFVFLFVRECLPSRPWTWTVGGLGAAFVPMFGFVSGMVNPDALLFAVSAALFFLIARAFRRGMTTQLAVWIGVALAVGAIGKINFYGLVPGALVAIVLAARMSEGAWGLRAARLAGIALAVGIAPYLLIMALDALVWERPFILAHTPAAIQRDPGGPLQQLGDLWQVYLPRLPGQTAAFESYPGYELWFKSFVGKFGGLIVPLPEWAYGLARAACVVLLVLAGRALVRDRAELRRHWAELLGYVLMAGGLLGLIGMVAVRGWAPGIAAAAQGRYLLPLLALLGAVFALAARGVGDRFGRAAGVLIVAVAVAWGLLGQLVAIAYFYG